MNIELRSDGHRAAVRDGVLRVYGSAPTRVPVVNGVIGEDGQIQVTSMKTIAAPSHVPMFAVTWDGDEDQQEFCLDLDCGAQRYNGTTTRDELQQALAQTGFDPPQAQELIGAVVAYGAQSCPRHDR